MKAFLSKSEGTKERIIAAAGEVFAERGFRATTIRQITARAEVNVAAVHYHFRDKGDLYTRVLREAKKHLGLIVIQEIPGDSEEKLLGFISRFVHYILDPKRPLWHGRVLALALSNPTPALGVVLREVTAPVYQDVRALIGEVVEGTASDTDLDLLTISIFGQCVFYVSGRPVVEQLAMDLGRQPDRTERIAAHVGKFSLAALRAFHQARSEQPRCSRAASLVSS
jgi:AcrR family transcriptional regulator